MNNNSILIEMGKRISQKRKLLGLTQEQLAEKIGVSTQMISNLELGKKAIRPENLIKVCQTLNVSADYLLMGKRFDKDAELFNKINSLNNDELVLLKNIVDYMNK